MSGAGAPRLETVDAKHLLVGVVAAQWHEELTGALLAGAENYLDTAGVVDRVVVRVPGSFELPVAAKALATAGCDAVIALGVVVRGGTPHFEYVCSAATDGLLRVTLKTGVPVGFGLLTCDTVEQAYERAGLPGSREDKGAEAAEAAVRTALSIRGLKSQVGELRLAAAERTLAATRARLAESALAAQRAIAAKRARLDREVRQSGGDR